MTTVTVTVSLSLVTDNRQTGHLTMTMATDTYLTPQQYADAHGKSLRTVYRYLDAGKLAGAQQLDDRGWMIPADATPGAGEPAGQAVERTGTPAPARRAAAPTAPTLAGMLAELPAYLDVDTAARLLGIPAGAIRRNRVEFGAVPYGPHGSLVVPQAAVRRVAGIAA